MRPVTHTDLDAVARALIAAGAGRERRLAQILAEADIADRYRKRLRKWHRAFGDGTLAAAARGHAMVPPRRCSDRDYMACLAMVLEALLWRDQPPMQSRQSAIVGSAASRAGSIASPQSTQ